MKIHFLALGENLDLFWAIVEVKHKQPKILRWEYDGVLRKSSSKGVLLERRADGSLLMR